MDSVKASEWDSRFRGVTIDGWTIESLIDHGKSAAVFRASGTGGSVALKIFDDEIIQRYGGDAQLGRINRELTLVGKTHPNMVRLLGGGVHAESNNHFIVMEFLDGPSLSKCLAEVPAANVASLIEQLVSACEFLESLGLAHRDIKPANIVLLEDHSRLVLLDFGVLKPIGDAGLTDVDGQRIFVGTLQYSSPEYLLRKESGTSDGWRALSLYQVGAVLHDLIMRKAIFSEFVNPYAALVNAVQHELPGIASDSAPSYLVDACRMALVKDPVKRLELVNWNSFRPPAATSAAEAARKRVNQRILLGQAETTTTTPAQDMAAAQELLDTVIEGLKVEFRRIRQANSSLMPPIEVTRTGRRTSELTVQMKPSEKLHLPKGLRLKIDVVIIDTDAQAIIIKLAAAGGDIELEKVSGTEIFKGPYSSGAIGDRLAAALFVSLDQAQQGSTEIFDLKSIGDE